MFETLSLLPVFGTPFDIILVGINISEGKTDEAIISVVGIIPGGDALKLIKVGKYGKRGRIPTKQMTEPTLPKGTIVRNGDVKIASHYKGEDEHAPPHIEVTSDGGRGKTKIGAMGGEIKGSRSLTQKERSVVNANKSKIRTAVNKIRNYLRYKKFQDLELKDK